MEVKTEKKKQALKLSSFSFPCQSFAVLVSTTECSVLGEAECENRRRHVPNRKGGHLQYAFLPIFPHVLRLHCLKSHCLQSFL